MIRIKWRRCRVTYLFASRDPPRSPLEFPRYRARMLTPRSCFHKDSLERGRVLLIKPFQVFLNLAPTTKAPHLFHPPALPPLPILTRVKRPRITRIIRDKPFINKASRVTHCWGCLFVHLRKLNREDASNLFFKTLIPAKI